MSVNAAVKPDFAIVANSDEGAPFPKAINENTKAHPNSTMAIERGYGILNGDLSLQFMKYCEYKELGS